MKQKGIILITLVFAFLGTKAQKIYLGLELGSNVISVEKTALGRNFQLGPYAGVSLNYNLRENLRISSGLFYSQRKKMYFESDTSSAFDDLLSFGGNSEEFDSLVNMPGVDMSVYENTKGMATENYLEIPIMVSYTYDNFVVSAGPYVGFLMSARKKEEIRTTTPLFQVFDVSLIDSTGMFSMFLPPADETRSTESSSINNLQRFDIGAAFGLGYRMDNVKFNLSYTIGFRDYRIDQGADDKNTHKAIRASVSYYFGSGETEAKPSL